MAPANIDRASTLAYPAPSLWTVRVNVASATDGAAPNNPANVFGLNTFPTTAKAETIIPPIKKRIITSWNKGSSVRPSALMHQPRWTLMRCVGFLNFRLSVRGAVVFQACLLD